MGMIFIGGNQITIIDLEADPQFFHNGNDGAYWLINEHLEDILGEMLDNDLSIHAYNTITDLYINLTSSSVHNPLPNVSKIFHPVCNRGVRITMTGTYLGDFQTAAQAAITTFGNTLQFDGRGCMNGYVWHHVENPILNGPNNSSCTMELLTILSHSKIHSGAVNAYRNAFNGGYGR
jgi:hypothetical protein